MSKADIGLSRGRRLTVYLIGLIALITLGIGLLLGLWSFASYKFVADGEGADTEQVFVVPRGAGINSVADKLEAEGFINNARLYKIVMRFRDPEARLIPGEFALSPAMSMAEITDVLKSGKIIQYKFTAPEGLTVAQILRLLDTDPVLIDDDPEAPPEGRMLPETYLFARGTTQSELVQQMVDAHNSVVGELWAARAPGLPLASPEEAVILASIVEKETGIDGERDKVAGVFINRLRRPMRLESDPTIIYGISKGEPLGRGLRRSEIDRKTPWNTYQIDGLPPTPIANPGRAAIAAVLNPAPTEALFFVADGTGGHVFARTYREHLNNVARWRQIERQRRNQDNGRAQ